MASILQKIAPLFLLIFSCTTLLGQVKIGDNPQNIDPSSVLELESTSRVLVITRVNTVQMDAITPSRGALVYNTDTECIHYYDGTQWINICDSIGGLTTITNVPSLTRNPTVLVTETTNGNTVNYNLEVGEITGSNIVDSTIGGADLSPRSVGSNNLAENSVGNFQLAENAVEDDEINFAVVTLSDFTNDAGYITTANIVSGDADNSILVGSDNAAFLNLNPLQNSVAANTAAIAADQDGNANNESLTAATLDGTELVLTESGNETRVNLGAFSNSGTDDQNLESAILTGTNLAINIEGGNDVVADLSALGTDLSTTNEIQALSISGNTLTLNNGGGSVTLPTTDGGSLDIGDQFDGITIIGDGSAADRFRVANIGSVQIIDGTISVNDIGVNAIQTTSIIDNNVTTTKIADGNVTPIKIEPSTVNGQFLSTDGAGNVAWANLPATGSPDVFDPTTISGAGTAGDPRTVADNGITTIKILDENVTPAKIEASATAGQVLTTDAVGDVVWADLPPGSGGGSDVFDATTISGAGTAGDPRTVADNGITTIKILDENVTPAKIEASATAGQVLTTDAVGDVVWADLPPGSGGGSDVFDATTISGAGTAGDPRTVADNGITTIKILDENVTPAKIEASATAGQFLSTDAVGDVVWANAPLPIVDATTISGTGVVATPFTVADNGITTIKILDENVTPAKIEASATAGQFLSTDAVGDVVWANAPLPIVDATTISGTGVVATPFTVADNGITTIKLLDENVTPAKIEASATAGQFLSTDAVGDVVWADAPVPVVDATTISGTGVVATPFTVADNGITTIKLLDENVTPAKIEASATAGQFLSTDAVGDVVWADAPVPVVDATTISGTGVVATPFTVADNGITTIKILDENVTPAKIEASATAGQFLSTDAVGDVVWANAPVPVVDAATISGTGVVATPFTVADNGITTIKILDENVTPAKIEASATAGQVLTTDAVGDVIWADTALPIVNPATISGTGVVATPFTVADNGITTIKILDENVTPAKIEASATAGQFLSTDAVGDVVWADAPVPVVDATTISGTGVVATPFTVADNGITTIKLLDENVTPAKIEASATAGQVLTTDAVGDVVWADTALPAVNPATISGTGIAATPFTVADDGITADKIGANVAGAGLQQNAITGALEVDPAFSASSFSANIRTDPAAAVTIADADYTVIITNAAANVTLPAAAAANTGRIYILKNTSGVDVTIDNYLDAVGAGSTTLGMGITQLQSDGATWQQIN
ncbi:beta strand repeat-containing protein [Spongiimicrobium salis]|uniref:beta strand repeat-containing protein n=1 Tax=Spongiimicrobium salis TaxID=1667022 RepID=UPI00374CA24B